MADKRDEENEEGGPKIRVVDRRMLSDDERAGKGEIKSEVQGSKSAKTQAGQGEDEKKSAPPKLEIIGGGQAKNVESAKATAPVEAAQNEGDEEERELTEEEAAQLLNEAENAEFAAIEQQVGRPLTEQEKEAVRAEMQRQAQAMASLEVAPVLRQFMVQMSQVAAVHMGLMPNPYTRLIARNDLQARLAIDAFAAVLEVVKAQLDANSQREYARVLNDLRVNFVSITGSQPTGPVGTGGGPRIIH